MESSIPPFYVGQKVIAIDDCPECFSEGERFTITGLTNDCDCGWHVTVGIIDNNCRIGKTYRCPGCNGKYINTTLEEEFDPEFFRAITEAYQGISFSEIKEQVLTSVN